MTETATIVGKYLVVRDDEGVVRVYDISKGEGLLLSRCRGGAHAGPQASPADVTDALNHLYSEGAITECEVTRLYAYLAARAFADAAAAQEKLADIRRRSDLGRVRRGQPQPAAIWRDNVTDVTVLDIYRDYREGEGDLVATLTYGTEWGDARGAVNMSTTLAPGATREDVEAIVEQLRTEGAATDFEAEAVLELLVQQQQPTTQPSVEWKILSEGTSALKIYADEGVLAAYLTFPLWGGPATDVALEEGVSVEDVEAIMDRLKAEGNLVEVTDKLAREALSRYPLADVRAFWYFAGDGTGPTSVEVHRGVEGAWCPAVLATFEVHSSAAWGVDLKSGVTVDDTLAAIVELAKADQISDYTASCMRESLSRYQESRKQQAPYVGWDISHSGASATIYPNHIREPIATLTRIDGDKHWEVNLQPGVQRLDLMKVLDDLDKVGHLPPSDAEAMKLAVKALLRPVVEFKEGVGLQAFRADIYTHEDRRRLATLVLMGDDRWELDSLESDDWEDLEHAIDVLAADGLPPDVAEAMRDAVGEALS